MTDGENKAQALLVLIEKMMTRYKSNHRCFMDMEMFRLSRKAREIHSAKNEDELQSATVDL